MPRPRVRTVAIAAAVLLVVVVTALVVALPEIVRRVAVTQLTRLTGRGVSLDRVDLNLFTGRVALGRFRLAQRNSSEPAFELDGAEVRVSVPSLVTRHARVASVSLTRPRLWVARLTPTAFDFSDLLALIPPPDPHAKPSNRTVTIERLALTSGEVAARDDVTATAWKVEGLTIDGAGLSTRGGPPGRITVRAKLNGTPLGLEVGAIDLSKGAALARATVDGFDVAQVTAFVPPSLGVTPAAGRLSATLDFKTEKGTPSPSVTVAGTARVEGLAIHRATARAPAPAGAAADDGRIVSVGTVAIAIKDAQPLARVIALDTIAIDGVDLRVTRLEDGSIDLAALAARPAGSEAAVAPAKPDAEPAPPAPAPAESPASAALRFALRELTLRNSKVTVRDETVGATLALSDLGVTVRDVTWPATGPITFEVATALPSAGRLHVKGGATLAPITADFTMSMRGAPIAPYQPYLPIPGRIVGVFNGESRSRVAFADGKLTMAVSQGRSWIENLELRAPGAASGPAKIARVSIEGIDFAHPGRAKARSITVTKPELRIERDAAGEINLRQLFAADTPPITATRAPAPGGAASSPATPPVDAKPSAGRARATAAPPPGAGSPIPLEIGTFVIEDGYARFMDRTTKPAFSEEISKLAVRIDGLSSEPGHRAKLSVQALVGGDSALDLKGEVAPFGELYADVRGELRNFVLPRVNPYADTAIAWIIERGTLAVRVHYTVEKNQLTAQNEIIVDNLHVARSKSEDEVQKRIGLPLGLIVALVTDSNNGIRVNVPLNGSLESWSADLSDAIWTAVKNVVVNIVASPFRAIGRAFTGSGGDRIESLAIDPAPFAAGNATLAAEAERHVTNVADFLRKSPAIKLTLAPFTTAADAESLRGQELTARLQQVQREQKLDDLAAAVAVEFKRTFPEEPLPSTDEQLARLREKEPVPADAVGALATRRVEAVRAALTEKEGIPAARLTAGEAATATAGAGRVEFTITQ